jgi:hypothetical protein
MGAFGIEPEEQWPQEAKIEVRGGRRHERESRGLGIAAQWAAADALLMELITRWAGDYVPCAGEIQWSAG